MGKGFIVGLELFDLALPGQFAPAILSLVPLALGLLFSTLPTWCLVVALLDSVTK